MLIDFRVQNFKSFNDEQTLSMLASTSTKENFNKQNTIPINKLGVGSLVKSAAIFGANASGKSNLVNSLRVFRLIILDSLKSLESDSLSSAIPFFIKEDYFDIPTEFEVSFLFEEKVYRYGISIMGRTISEEWLYWTKNKRETMLFHRKGQKIEINSRSFSEAKDFVKEKDGSLEVDKTKDFVPFISVLSQFNGEKSNSVINWFLKLNIISGIRDAGIRDFTIQLFETNPEFKKWALDILGALQIQDVRVVEVDQEFPSRPHSDTEHKELSEVVEKLELFLKKEKFKAKKVEVVKIDSETGKKYVLPLAMESEGSRKLLYILGPLFDVIRNKEILVVDEFDNKFHTLLSKFIIDIYHQNNSSDSQLILTCHDTNLLNKELFRRDQIWFVEKNNKHESELYSLLEYKEYYARKSDSYSKDYLAGKYGAVPLFSSINDLSEV